MEDDFDPVRAAEFHEDNFKRVEADVRETLKHSGCIFPTGVVQALTCTVLEESLQTRRRMAFMVNAFTEAFGDELTADKMARFEFVMACHWRDEHNLGFMPFESDSTNLS